MKIFKRNSWFTFLTMAIAGCTVLHMEIRASAANEPLPEPGTRLVHTPFVAFDTETTGLDPNMNSMVELAAVKYIDGKITEEKTWLINPHRNIPYWSTKVHKITNKMVKDEPTFKDIYPEFLEFIDGSVLMAHNASFDISFIRVEAERAGLKPPPNPVIDSLPLFRKWFPGLDSYRLQSVAKHTDTKGEAFHRALADSAYVALIFDKGIRKRLGPASVLDDVYKAAGGILHF